VVLSGNYDSYQTTEHQIFVHTIDAQAQGVYLGAGGSEICRSSERQQGGRGS